MSKFLLSNIFYAGVLIFIISFLITYFIIPKIIWIVNNLELNDVPNARSSHKKAIPTMAGVAFFITLIIVLFLIQKTDKDGVSINLIAAVTLIFIIGLKDDLVLSTPRAKLLMECLAILLISFCECMKIPTLNGCFGIENIPVIIYYLGILIGGIIIINAYNLIDGIDGLAISIGIIIFSIYAFIFYETGLYYYLLLCLSLIGILLAYSRYNISLTNKAFMGDTGSLIIGFCITFFTIKFMNMGATIFNPFNFKLENQLFVVLAILNVPLFDLIRVSAVRLFKRKNPFYADRNHLHHILIDIGISHFKSSLILGFINYSVVILIIYLSSHFNSYQMVGFTIVIFLLFVLTTHELNKLRKLKKHIF